MTVTPIETAPSYDDGRSLDVCRIAGISYRQLDYWARTGLLVPTTRQAKGSGTQRLYTDADILRACVIATLLAAGFSLAGLREQVDGVMATADTGVGFFSHPNVVITVDIGVLRERIELHKQQLAEQQAAP